MAKTLKELWAKQGGVLLPPKMLVSSKIEQTDQTGNNEGEGNQSYGPITHK